MFFLISGLLRQQRGVERAGDAERDQGDDAGAAVAGHGRRHAGLQDEAHVQGRPRQVHLCRCVIHHIRDNPRNFVTQPKFEIKIGPSLIAPIDTSDTCAAQAT